MRGLRAVAARRRHVEPEAPPARRTRHVVPGHDLGLDRVEIRRRNLITPDQFPYRTPTGNIYDSGNYQGVLEKVLEAVDYDHWVAALEKVIQEAGKKDPPKPLPKSFIEAWTDAGAEVCWLRVDELGFLKVIPQKDGKPSDLPGFNIVRWHEGTGWQRTVVVGTRYKP